MFVILSCCQCPISRCGLSSGTSMSNCVIQVQVFIYIFNFFLPKQDSKSFFLFYYKCITGAWEGSKLSIDTYDISSKESLWSNDDWQVKRDNWPLYSIPAWLSYPMARVSVPVWGEACRDCLHIDKDHAVGPPYYMQVNQV